MGTRERITIPQDMSELARSAHTEPPPSGVVSTEVTVDAVPWLNVPYDTLLAMPLDARQGFLLSLVDGRCTVEMILDMSGMPRTEVFAMLAELVAMGVLTLRLPGR